MLPVIVTDKQGRYVGDLPRDRFTVYDNGRRVAIELFSNEDTPVTVGLLIGVYREIEPENLKRAFLDPLRTTAIARAPARATARR